MKQLRDFLLGGPGLCGYAFRADTYCVACGRVTIRELWDTGKLSALTDNDGTGTTEDVPQPIFFGASDHRVHCAHCGEYLYGDTHQ